MKKNVDVVFRRVTSKNNRPKNKKMIQEYNITEQLGKEYLIFLTK